MFGKRARLVLLTSVLCSTIAGPTVAQFTMCTSTNLMLGQLTGSQIFDPNRGGYYWSGSASFTFDCPSANFAGCQVCGFAGAYYLDPDTGNYTLLTTAYDNTGTQGCGQTGLGGTIYVTYAPFNKLSTGTQYKIVVGITSYNPSVGSCPNSPDGYGLTSYVTFTGE